MAIKKITTVTVPVKIEGGATSSNITFKQEHTADTNTVEATIGWAEGRIATFTIDLKDLSDALIMLRGSGLMGILSGLGTGFGNGSSIEENS